MDRKTKRTKANQGLARAKLLWRRDLAWTHGFPLSMLRPICLEAMDASASREISLEWIAIDGMCVAQDRASLIVDRELLRRSEFAASKLRHQFPRAIKTLFEDSADWFDRFDRLISILKRVVHSGDASAVDAAELCRVMSVTSAGNAGTWPDDPFVATLNAFRFAERFTPHSPEHPLDDWLMRANVELEQVYLDPLGENRMLPCGLSIPEWEIGLMIELRSALTRADTLRAVGGALTCRAIRNLHFPDPNLFSSILAEQARAAIGHSRKTDKSQHQFPPRETLRQTLIRCLQGALAAKLPTQKAIVESIATVGRESVLRKLEKIGVEVEVEESRLRQLVQRLHTASETSIVRSKKQAKPILDEIDSRPVSVDDVARVHGVERFLHLTCTSELSVPLQRTVNRFVGVCGDRSIDAMLLSLSMFPRWGAVGGRYPWRDERLNLIFSGLIGVAADTGRGESLVELLMPSAHKWQRRDGFFEEWLPRSYRRPSSGRLRHNPPPRGVDSLQRVWPFLSEAVQASLNMQCRSVRDSLDAIAASDLPADTAIELLQRLAAEGEDNWVDDDEVNSILPFASEADEVFEVWSRLQDVDEAAETLKQLKPLAKSTIGRGLVRSWIFGARWKRASFFAALLSRLKGQAFDFVPDDESPRGDWIASFPDSLRPSLELLNRVSSGAELTAREILASDFVDRDKHQRELAYLREKLDQADVSNEQLAKYRNRCERIEHQLRTITVPSAKRLQNLSDKLEQRAQLEYERWLETELTELWCATLSHSIRQEAKNWLADPTCRHVVLGISALKEHQRAWGFELIRLSLARLSFPETDYSPNREFLERLAEHSIDAQPWMDLKYQKAFALNEDSRVILSFASDPMDYLLMGHHFQTCLSPQSFNFFSTISNAIDVNKRVIYGRDLSGKVLGRCLIALSDSGSMVRFHAYSHSDGAAFNRVIELFIDELAQRMKATRSASATIRTLLSRDWYDDGPIGDGQTIQEEWIRLLAKLSEVSNPTHVDRQELNQLLERIWKSDERLEWAFLELRNVDADWIQAATADYVLAPGRSSIDVRVEFAVTMFATKRFDRLQETVEAISRRDWLRLFRRSVCWHDDCFGFHNLGTGDPDFIEAVLAIQGPTQALRLLRASRKRSIRADDDEPCRVRRRMLARFHQDLGRTRLAERLRRAKG